MNTSIFILLSYWSPHLTIYTDCSDSLVYSAAYIFKQDCTCTNAKLTFSSFFAMFRFWRTMRYWPSIAEVGAGFINCANRRFARTVVNRNNTCLYILCTSFRMCVWSRVYVLCGSRFHATGYFPAGRRSRSLWGKLQRTGDVRGAVRRTLRHQERFQRTGTSSSYTTTTRLRAHLRSNAA